MVEESKLVATSREDIGSGAARRLRRDGWLPGIISTAKGSSTHIQLNSHDFGMMLHRHSGENLMIDVEVDGKNTRKLLLREIQRDPLTDKPLHVDFVEVSMTRKMRVSIPVSLAGEPVGVSQSGGVLDQPVRELEVECLPGDLVEEIVVDVSGLEIGDSIQAGDVRVGDKLTIVTPEDVAVASVLAPRVEEEAEVVEEAAEGEPEVIGEDGEKEEEGKEESSES